MSRRWSMAAALVAVGPLVAWSMLGADPAKQKDAPPAEEERAEEEHQVSDPAQSADAASSQAVEDVDWKAISEDEWRKRLTPEQYRVARQKGTEGAFTGEYWNSKKQGTYKCVGCRLELFQSEAKFHSGCGWPSFFEPIDKETVDTAPDFTQNMRRTEVVCPRCGAHLGHVFNDGPHPTGLRYCINSLSLKLEEKPAKKDTRPEK